MSITRLSILLSIGPILEATAYPKPGNVHRLRDFPDTRFEDFMVSGLVFVPFMAKCIRRGIRGKYGKVVIGDIIYGIVRNSMEIHGGGNTCLGTATLLSPIALSIGYYLGRSKNLRLNISMIVKKASSLVREYSTVLDAIYFYKAIRFIKPSYLSRRDKTGNLPNVFTKDYAKKLMKNNVRLWDILIASSKFDLVCSEVVNAYSITLKAMEFLKEKLRKGIDWNYVVVDTFLYVLSNTMDTLVVRKHGVEAMKYVSMKAHEILSLGGSSNPKGFKLLKELDKELSTKKINPGASADIVATSISLYALTKGEKIIR